VDREAVKVGDVVILAGTRNGRTFEQLCAAHATMTVIEPVTPEGRVTVLWLYPDDSPETETFPPGALELVKSEDP
jgi:hypothetical protein